MLFPSMIAQPVKGIRITGAISLEGDGKCGKRIA
jgi:hypothetical protein